MYPYIHAFTFGTARSTHALYQREGTTASPSDYECMYVCTPHTCHVECCMNVNREQHLNFYRYRVMTSGLHTRTTYHTQTAHSYCTRVKHIYCMM